MCWRAVLPSTRAAGTLRPCGPVLPWWWRWSDASGAQCRGGRRRRNFQTMSEPKFHSRHQISEYLIKFLDGYMASQGKDAGSFTVDCGDKCPGATNLTLQIVSIASEGARREASEHHCGKVLSAKGLFTIPSPERFLLLYLLSPAESFSEIFNSGGSCLVEPLKHHRGTLSGQGSGCLATAPVRTSGAAAGATAGALALPLIRMWPQYFSLRSGLFCFSFLAREATRGEPGIILSSNSMRGHCLRTARTNLYPRHCKRPFAFPSVFFFFGTVHQ